MKKIILSLCLASLVSFSQSALGSQNPFADISPEHWSYQATKELVDSGLVDDYSNSMFNKNRRIARYALVQLVGQAVYRIDEATPEQKTVIEKLAAEYNEDLTRMGAVTVISTQQASPSEVEEISKRVDKLEEETVGIKGLKVSGFLQTENTYGRRYHKNDADHEYELEARIQFDKKITDKLSYSHQLATKTYLDAYSAVANDNYGQEFPNSNKEKVYTRFAYLDWRPDQNTSLQAGKLVVWLAGGLLGDDYVKGVMVNHKTNDGTELSFLASRYASGTNWPGMTVISDGKGGYELFRGSTDRNIWYAKVAKTFGATNVGLHYLKADNSFVSKEDTEIYAATVDVQWQKINWSFGYAQNTAESKHNSLYKLQALKRVGPGDVILQYWRNEQNINLPLEHGNHMAFWTDTYNNEGLHGGRFIYAWNISNNILLETFYGYYKSIQTGKSASKYGFATTMTF